MELSYLCDKCIERKGNVAAYDLNCDPELSKMMIFRTCLCFGFKNVLKN
jgi:hypothetical protein